jgi:hypothetical protein
MLSLEKQVVSLELAKKLKSLNVEQESYFYWRDFDENLVIGNENKMTTRISAFTVAELGEMLKNVRNMRHFYTNTEPLREWCSMTDSEREYGDTEANVRAKMLCYLLENKLITP